VYPHRAGLKNMPGHGGWFGILTIKFCYFNGKSLIEKCSETINNIFLLTLHGKFLVFSRLTVTDIE
jgi:hypothetical protein